MAKLLHLNINIVTMKIPINLIRCSVIYIILDKIGNYDNVVIPILATP